MIGAQSIFWPRSPTSAPALPTDAVSSTCWHRNGARRTARRHQRRTMPRFRLPRRAIRSRSPGCTSLTLASARSLPTRAVIVTVRPGATSHQATIAGGSTRSEAHGLLEQLARCEAHCQRRERGCGAAVVSRRRATGGRRAAAQCQQPDRNDHQVDATTPRRWPPQCAQRPPSTRSRVFSRPPLVAHAQTLVPHAASRAAFPRRACSAGRASQCHAHR
mgnify:CR=1 FL=1